MSADIFEQNLRIKISDRDFHIACGEEDRQNLLDAAQLINHELMKQNVGNSGLVSLESGAIMVALNLAGEMLKQNPADDREFSAQDRHLIDHLIDELTQVLDK